MDDLKVRKTLKAIDNNNVVIEWLLRRPIFFIMAEEVDDAKYNSICGKIDRLSKENEDLNLKLEEAEELANLKNEIAGWSLEQCDEGADISGANIERTKILK